MSRTTSTVTARIAEMAARFITTTGTLPSDLGWAVFVRIAEFEATLRAHPPVRLRAAQADLLSAHLDLSRIAASKAGARRAKEREEALKRARVVVAERDLALARRRLYAARAAT